MKQQARRTCIGWSEHSQHCPHTPARNSERCRPCQRIFKQRSEPANADGIKRHSCPCGRNGRVYLGLLCNQCFIDEYAFRLWKEDGCPDNEQPYSDAARAEFKRLRKLWQDGEHANAEAQGIAIQESIRQRAQDNALSLAKLATPPTPGENSAINEFIARANGRHAILTLSDGSSFTVNEDGTFGDEPGINLMHNVVMQLRNAPQPVGIILRIFTGEYSTVPFPNDPSRMLPLKEIASCLYQQESIIPLPAEDTREAHGQLGDDVICADW